MMPHEFQVEEPSAHRQNSGVVTQTQQTHRSCEDKRGNQEDQLQTVSLERCKVIDTTKSKCTCSFIYGCLSIIEGPEKKKVTFKFSIERNVLEL